MTPREKATSLMSMLCGNDCTDSNIYDMKHYALIIIDEVIEALDSNQWQNRSVIEYYREVKQEIHKL